MEDLQVLRLRRERRNLSLTDSPVNGTTSKKSFYSTNPHGDVETLTDATGSTTSTYRYTAYGQPDKTGTTGDDTITGNANQDADVVNPYRFNSSRFDGATNTYDMGFREYNPGLNRFLTRDTFNGALQDLALGTDPWNANRYMFGGGNPISRIELNGHYAVEEGENRLGPRQSPTPTITSPTTTESTTPPSGVGTPAQQDHQSAGEKFGKWLVEKPLDERLAEEVVVKPVQETYEACRAAVMTAPGSASWQQCQIGIGLTALSFTGGGKVVGIGVRTAEGLAAAESGSQAAGWLARQTAAASAEYEVKAYAQVLSVAKGRTPRASSAAVDRVTGKVYLGHSGDKVVSIPKSLLAKLPNPSMEPWAPTNCAEVAACSRAINNGADLDNLVVYTIKTKSLQYFAPCANCASWLPGG